MELDQRLQRSKVVSGKTLAEKAKQFDQGWVGTQDIQERVPELTFCASSPEVLSIEATDSRR